MALTVTTRIGAMTPDQYPHVLALWQRTAGVGLGDSDTERATGAFLARNPGMSAVAIVGSEIVGAVLCGHDGRRGYLHHLAVADAHRRRGIGARLVAWCIDRLAEAGIAKCNVFLFTDNDDGAGFWVHNGWEPRTDLRVLQRTVAGR